LHTLLITAPKAPNQAGVMARFISRTCRVYLPPDSALTE